MVAGAAVTPAYTAVLIAGLLTAAAAAIVGRFTTTPYGRFATASWGPTLPIRAGWLVMEAPALPVFWGVLLAGPHAFTPLAMAGAALWTVHYLNRSLAFPLLMRARPDGRMAWAVAASGFAVVCVHAWLYATWLTALTPDPTLGPRFAVGAAVWAIGFALIVDTERRLRQLRRDADAPRYQIPLGGGFGWVSSPHYLGELLAFTGLLVALACPGGAVVLALTVANLVPRAAATHAWYLATFPDYPPERRALLPYLW